MNTGQQQLVLDLLSAHAAELARAGDYEAAETLLSPMSNAIQDSAPCLDLLARIRAQQGAVSDADTLWTRAAKLSQSNSEYDDCLKRVAKMRKWPRWCIYRRVIAMGGLALLVVAVSIILVWKLVQPIPSAAGLTAATPSPPTRTAEPNVLSQSELKVNPIEQSALEVDGVVGRKVGDEIILTFTSGLFIRGVRFRPGAKDRLAAVANKLGKLSDISVQVVGVTDDLTPPTGAPYQNATLAMRRAFVVAEYMQTSSTLPTRAIGVAYGDISQSPFANDSFENRTRNRSVIIRVSKSED